MIPDPLPHPSPGPDDDPTIGSSQAAAQRASAASRLFGGADDDHTVRHAVAARTETPAVSPTLGARKQFGDYQLLKEIGRGGMGVVFEALQGRLDRTVAVKMILAGEFASDEQIQRFIAEARSVAHLDHPNIVPVYEVGEHAGLHFFSMKRVDGGPLTAQIASYTGKYVDIAVLVEKVARAVHHAHQRGVLHRDLKPGNILIDSDREPMVTDFGLAKVVADDQHLARSEAVVGTPAYMAPEQARGVRHATTATDVWAIGAILYHLLTGSQPFKAATPLETLRLLTETQPAAPRKRRPSIPRDLETVCLKCLQKDPARRYATAAALADDLRRFIAGKPVDARPVGRLDRLWRGARRNPVLAAAGSVAVLALLATLITLISAVGIVGRDRDEARRNADANAEQLQAERALRRQAEWASVDRLLDSAIHRHARNDPAVGLVWLTHTLQEADRIGAADMSAAIRRQIAGWARAVHPLKSVSSEVVAGGWVARRVAMSPDGRRAYAFDPRQREPALLCFDASTGRRLGEPLPLPASPRCMAVDPGSGRVVLGLVDGTLRCAAPDAARFFDSPLMAMPIGSSAATIAFNRSGSAVAAVSEDGVYRAWRMDAGAPIGDGRLPAGANGLWSAVPAALSDDATMLTTVVDGNVLNLPLSDGAQQISVGNVAGPALAVRYAVGGRELVVVTRTELYRLLLNNNGLQPPPVLLSGSDRPQLTAAAISRDGRRIIYTDGGPVARCLDLSEDAQMSAPWRHADMVESVAISDDGLTALTGAADGSLRCFGIRTTGGMPSAITSSRPLASQLSPNGSLLAIGCADGSVLLYEPTTLRLLGRLLHEGAVACVAFTPDSRVLLTGSSDQSAQLWDVATGRPLGKPVWHEGGLAAVQFSGDGRRMLTASTDGIARVRQLIDGTQIGPDISHDGRGIVALSYDGRLVVAVGTDGVARIWEVGRPLATPAELRHAAGAVASAVFSPDGTKIVTTGADRTVRVWSMKGAALAALSLPHRDDVHLVAWSPAGDRLATAGRDRIVRVWDWARERVLCASVEQSSLAAALAFSQDASWIGVGGEDGTMTLIESGTARAVGPPVMAGGEVIGVSFLPSGGRVACVAQSGVAVVVPLGPATGSAAELRDWTQRTTGLTLDEAGTVQVLRGWPAKP
jgi:WD40 repeat protein